MTRCSAMRCTRAAKSSGVPPANFKVERRCAAEWGEVVRPDGFGALRRAGTVVEFFVEYDAGTETLDRVAAKLGAMVSEPVRTGREPVLEDTMH